MDQAPRHRPVDEEKMVKRGRRGGLTFEARHRGDTLSHTHTRNTFWFARALPVLCVLDLAPEVVNHPLEGHALNTGLASRKGGGVGGRGRVLCALYIYI